MLSVTAKRVTVTAKHSDTPCKGCHFHRNFVCGRILPAGIDPELVRAVNTVENETGKSCISGYPYIWIKD